MRVAALARSWFALSVLCLGVLAVYVSETSVAIALEDIAGTFGASMTATAWVATIYVLMVGTFVPLAPTIGERFGYKRTFLFAYALFIVGSATSGCAPNLPTLLIGRAIQGSGGSLLAPCVMRLVSSIVPEEKLDSAMGVIAACAGAGVAIGPTLAGYLLDTYNWHSIFWVNVLLGLIILPMGQMLLCETDQIRQITFDWWGFVLIAVTSSSLLLALANGNAAWNTGGWTSPFILTAFGVFIASGSFLLLREQTFSAPAIHLRLMKSPSFFLPSISIFVVGFGLLGTGFILPIFMQKYLGYSKLTSGLTFGPGGIAMFFISFYIARICRRIGAFVCLVPGFLITCLAYWIGMKISLQSDCFTMTLISLFRGVGMGLLISPLVTLSVNSLPLEERGYGAALIMFMYQLGMSVGVALFQTITVRRTIFHTAILSQSTNPDSARYEQVFSRIRDAIVERGSAMPGFIDGQSQTLIANHLQKVAMAAAVCDVITIALWFTLGVTGMLILYKAYEKLVK